MIYIKSLNWTNDLAIEKKSVRNRLFPLYIEFDDPITVIVGKNGSGKSRLFHNIEGRAEALRSMYRYRDDTFHRDYYKDEADRYDIELELNQEYPMTTDILNYKAKEVFNDGFYSGDVLQLAKHWMSNGEIRQTLMERIRNCADSMRKDGVVGVMMLDEIDHGLDYTKQRKMARLLKQSSDVLQFIVATHNIPFMMQFEKLYDIEHKCYVSSEDYVNKIIRRQK